MAKQLRWATNNLLAVN